MHSKRRDQDELKIVSHKEDNFTIVSGHATGYDSRYFDRPNRTVQFSNSSEAIECSS